MGPPEGPSHLFLQTGTLKAFDSSALLNSPVLPDETTVLLPNPTPLGQWPILMTYLDMGHHDPAAQSKNDQCVIVPFLSPSSASVPALLK